jgi:hypothetical protein
MERSVLVNLLPILCTGLLELVSQQLLAVTAQSLNQSFTLLAIKPQRREDVSHLFNAVTFQLRLWRNNELDTMRLYPLDSPLIVVSQVNAHFKHNGLQA